MLKVFKYYINCKTCGTAFGTNAHNRKYCNCKCSPDWIVRNSLLRKQECKYCGRIFNTTRRRQIYCSPTCSVKHRKKLLIYSDRTQPTSDEWDIIREYILERDGYKCNECGSIEYLHIHHIMFLSKGGSNVEDNLITLCRICHAKKHYAM